MWLRGLLPQHEPTHFDAYFLADTAAVPQLPPWKS